jgi:hypothetical protein
MSQTESLSEAELLRVKSSSWQLSTELYREKGIRLLIEHFVKIRNIVDHDTRTAQSLEQ